MQPGCLSILRKQHIISADSSQPCQNTCQNTVHKATRTHDATRTLADPNLREDRELPGSKQMEDGRCGTAPRHATEPIRKWLLTTQDTLPRTRRTGMAAPCPALPIRTA